jgi:acetyl-CoA synthetase
MRRLNVPDIEELHEFAVQCPEKYYTTLVEYLNVRFSEPFTSLVDLRKGTEFPRWFPGGKLNIIDSCLRNHSQKGWDSPAVVVVEEERTEPITLTYADLCSQVQNLANHLVDIGIRRGDCVGLFMPMTVEATIAFFACAWVGAIAVPAFSGYGPDALATRLQNSAARLLITSTGFQRKGSWVDMHSVVIAATSKLSKLDRVICVGGASETCPRTVRWENWSESLKAGSECAPVAPIAMEPNDPLLLIYTSGTTGRPKGIVHSHAGFLLKVVGDYAIAFNVHQNDRFCWITDLGWLVGPQMMVANAAIGSTAVYYVGALDMPDWEQIWRVCEQQKVSILGISPTAVRGMAAASPYGPQGKSATASLHTFVSTGEPWDSASWRWLFERVGRSERPILNYSGGTEIGGGILTCYAALPVKDCAFTGPVVGMDADIIFQGENPTAESMGELAVRNIWPGMTHSFWGDDDERYLDTYWSTFPGVWVHGDLAQRNAEGWWFIRGRSDDTLKVAGRRVGPAEIENVLLQSDGVMEAAVVGVPDEFRGQSIVAFVVMTGTSTISPEVLRAGVRGRLGSSLVPSKIIFVRSLPKTRNGKVVRRAILARYLGKSAGDLSTLENIDSLLEIPQAIP